MKWTSAYSRSLIGGIIFLAVVWVFKPIVSYILISAIVGAAGRPLMRLLGKIRLGKKTIGAGLRAALVLVLMLSVITALVAILSPAIISQGEAIREIDLDEVSLQLDNKLNPVKYVLRDRQLVETNNDFRESIQESVMKLLEGIDLKTMFANALGATGSFFMSFFAILFMSFFFIKDEDLFTWIVLLFVSERNQSKVSNILAKVRTTMNRYFFGLLIEVSSMMVLLSVGGLIIGLENAILIGFLGGLLNVIPYLGPVIGASIAAVLVLISNIVIGIDGALLMTGQILIVFALANMVDNFVLQPLIYSNSVEMHPMAIFIIIFAGGMIGGPVGMIVAIPVMTVLRITVGEFFGDNRMVHKLTKGV